MAYTVTRTHVYSVGNKKCVVLKVTADAATQTVAAATTGMKYIDFFSVGIQTCTTGGFHIAPNLDASGAASNGAIGMSGLASNDIAYVHLFGR